MLASLATRICSRQPQSTIMKDSMSCIRFGFTRICLFLWLFVSFMLACLVESFSMHPLSSFTPSCSTIAPATRQLYMASSSSSSFDHDYLELAWRYAKKPLLRIGSKGATLTHGNSLRQLLEAHTVVKVKINTRKYGSLKDAFLVVRDLAQEAGAPKGIELIQAREGDKVILFGLPGTLAKIQAGDFPPVVVKDDDEEEEEE